MRLLLRLTTVLVAAAAVSGCMSTVDHTWGSADRLDAPLGPTFGVALASMDNQIIDPTPAAGLPTLAASRGVQAIQRYEAGSVLVPQHSLEFFRGDHAAGTQRDNDVIAPKDDKTSAGAAPAGGVADPGVSK